MKRVLQIFVILLITTGCGKKYPIPPEPTTGGLPPLGSYVKDVNWPGSDLNYQNIKDVIVGKDGFIYVLDGEIVHKLLITGEEVGTITSPQNMLAISQDEERNIYFAGIDSVIHVISREGEWRALTPPDSLHNLCGITVSNEIYISDTLSDIVLGFIPDSNIVDTIARFGNGALYVDNPLDLWVDPMGRILTVSFNHNWVEAFPTDSTIPFLHLGGDDPDGDTTEGKFYMPVDVVSDDSGYIYVADSFRIQKFDEFGNFVTDVIFEDESPVSVAITDDGKYLIVGTRTHLYKFERFDGLQQGGGY